VERKITLVNICLIKQLPNKDLALRLNKSGAITPRLILLHADRDIFFFYNTTQLRQYYCSDASFANVSLMPINLYSFSFNTIISSRRSWYILQASS
jgi:hypothetical protein